MTNSALLTLSIALLAGLLLSRVAKKMGLPAVTAYLIAGVIIGPFLLGRFFGDYGLGFSHENSPENYKILCDLALGFIAFAIGNEFRLSQLKKIGRQATVIGIFQAVFTCIVVDIALISFSLIVGEDVFPLSAAIVLGAVATATAPAATLMVVKQYKAKGPLTDLLLPIVALDDAVGLVIFAVSFGIAGSLNTPSVNLLTMLLNPLLEVVLSIALGAVMGVLFTACEKHFHSNSKRMAVSVAFVMATVAISGLNISLGGGVHIAFSSLLSCMMLGTVFCNICDFSEDLMNRADKWTAPLLVLFFVISGAELDLSVFANMIFVLIGVIYIIFRSAGKYFGAGISARLTKCDESTSKYLGITLLPQAGVALGMASQALTLGECGKVVQSITLFAVLIYEIFGPFLTKVALTKAGDIQPEGRVSRRTEKEQNQTPTEATV